MRSLRDQALSVLLNCNPDRKAEEARAGDASAPVDARMRIEEPDGIPGRPARPVLVPHTELRQRSVASAEGRAALIHAIEAANAQTYEECVALELQSALGALGEIIGETTTEDLLGEIFSQFCIGK